MNKHGKKKVLVMNSVLDSNWNNSLVIHFYNSNCWSGEKSSVGRGGGGGGGGEESQCPGILLYEA